MNSIQRAVNGIDRFQQRHKVLAFPYAVIKKFGDDNGGYQAALITYYGFLSLFPLLLAAVTLMQLIFHNNPGIQHDVAASISSYFPLLGSQLQQSIHSTGKTGIGLVVSLLVTIYGARGASDALRFALDNMWQVPRSGRSGFPKSIGQSLLIMLGGAIGFAATVAVSSFSSSLGHALWVKIVLNLVGFGIAAAVLSWVFMVATSRNVGWKSMLPGATIAAGIIQLLLTFGGVLVANQLKGLNSLYGTFTIVLGLLFWIYLLARVLVYAAEIDTVRAFKLWPRSISDDNQTDADRRAYDLSAKSRKAVTDEHVHTSFEKSD